MSVELATAEDFQRVERKVDFLISMSIKTGRISKTMTIPQIAPMLGFSAQTLRTTKRYLLPRFGVSAYKGRVARWNTEEVMAHLQRPEPELIAEYEQYQENMVNQIQANRAFI